MNSVLSAGLKETQKSCSICRVEIKAGEAYHYHSKVLCEDCCIAIRTPRVRKTHWQYIGSIKTEYLTPSKSV